MYVSKPFIQGNNFETLTFESVGDRTTLTVTTGGTLTSSLGYTASTVPTLANPLKLGIYYQLVGGTGYSGNPNAYYVSSFTASTVKFGCSGTSGSASAGTLVVQSAPGSLASINLPAGNVVTNVAYTLNSAPTNELQLGAVIVSGANAPNGTSIIGLETIGGGFRTNDTSITPGTGFGIIAGSATGNILLGSTFSAGGTNFYITLVNLAGNSLTASIVGSSSTTPVTGLTAGATYLTNAYTITFSQTFTATASTYTFLNLLAHTPFQTTAPLPRLAYPAPTVSYSPATNLFSINAHPGSIIGKSLNPSQENDANASNVALQNYVYKYRLSNGSALDTSYAVLSGPIVFPSTNGTPMSYFETWTISFNEPLQALMPFPLVKSLDVDSSMSDGFSNEIGFGGASLVPFDNPFSFESAASGKQYVLSLPQEFVCTGSWNPFVGITITTSTVPVQLEGAGRTTCYSGVAPPPVTGGAAHAILFDYNFDVTEAHAIVQGIDYNPQGVLRWTNLTGGPLADISFNIYLKRRDGTLVPLDLPSDASIDIKLLFSKQP
jgi:hypothetical protein